MATDPLDLDDLTLRDRLSRGEVRATGVAATVSVRIAERDGALGAFAWSDADHLARQAEVLELHRRAGRPLGPLHGLPVALKDVIDTAGIPTGNGSVLDEGRVPAKDAGIVSRLKAAGAMIAGKAVTTELAFLQPAGTVNPHAADRTPGGSSAGSAVAVAAGLAPFAVGTQTGGSVIRPASYCGVTGYKPSFGAIPRTGILPQSPSLDTVGVFARTPAGAAMLAEALFGDDPGDPATAPAPHPRLFDTATQPPPYPPLLALIEPPGWEDADPEIRAAFAELADALGDRVFAVRLPEIFGEAAAMRERINLAEMAHCYRHYGARPDGLSPLMREALEAGRRVGAADYIAALEWRGMLNAGLAAIFARCDAILSPAAPGPAPGRETTGSSIFNGLWTLCGTPAVTVPILASQAGLPMGAQLTGPLGGDARLLRTAEWLFGWAAEGRSPAVS